MINDYCEGGLQMIDLVSFNKSLKTTWIKKKYLDSTNNGKWKVFIDRALKNHGCKNVFTGNLHYKRYKKVDQSLRRVSRRNIGNLGGS